MIVLLELLHAAHNALVHTPVGKGFLVGVMTAAVIDFNTFRMWKSWHDFATYDWGVATFRWVQGGVVGAVTSVGTGYL